MNEHFTLSCAELPELVKPRDELRQICTPFQNAQVGDVLGFIIDYSYRYAAQAWPITHVLLKGGRRGRTTSLLDIDVAREIAANKALVALQCRLPRREDLEKILDEMCAQDGETHYAKLLVMPDACLLVTENFMDEIVNGRYEGEEITQEVVDDCVRLLVQCPASAHEAMSVAGRRDEYAQLFGHWTGGIIDPDTEEMIVLKAPERMERRS